MEGARLALGPAAVGGHDDLVALWARCGLIVSYNNPGRDIELVRATPTAEVFVGLHEGRILAGLCVGHDSLFFKHSEGLATTLVAKDRVLAHNPIGALHLADSYYSRVWGPDRPEKPPKQPAQGRRK